MQRPLGIGLPLISRQRATTTLDFLFQNFKLNMYVLWE